MKKQLPTALVALALCTTTVASTGCYGSYGAFNAVHKWNGKVSGNKVGNSAVHLALWIIPVYELALAADFLILNNVEFLTGSNPIK